MSPIPPEKDKNSSKNQPKGGGGEEEEEEDGDDDSEVIQAENYSCGFGDGDEETDNEESVNGDGEGVCKYYENGQIMYQQLGDGDDGDDDDDDDKCDVMDDFQQLAESRFAIKKPPIKENVMKTNDELDDEFRKLENEHINLDNKREEEINKIMSNFSLPATCVPEWAKQIPEELWKRNLIEKLAIKKTDLFESGGDGGGGQL